jgi:hypothetical protein
LHLVSHWLLLDLSINQASCNLERLRKLTIWLSWHRILRMLKVYKVWQGIRMAYVESIYQGIKIKLGDTGCHGCNPRDIPVGLDYDFFLIRALAPDRPVTQFLVLLLPF